jgi:transcription elongation factor B subunit 1|eukprot:CAMPEP_0174355408 /NCGR_PEP_ID=MMETSP0811_2-20130205/24938_1 /TAXON_ID=73025 ORGANISM="Eutreptiella gymnastica-like, Strain CCMP1594" /NCGR_SAMPLE_ID=MMETSP0811_2 /ASSEMBLY_ACC=CAM_ASM_000667 /LENGTH=125 /DNA_ID=CAMNT_0015486757 /DNA_START=17 /DNA_END=394 /DNA_ORIENTATION=-
MADKKKPPGKGAPPPEGEAVDKTPAFDVTQTVRLVSKDGFEFVLHKNCAMVSKTVKTMLNSPQSTKEMQEGMIHLPSIDAPVLEKAIQYFHYKYRYDNDPDNRPPFQVPPEMALDLMLVAHYLDT